MFKKLIAVGATLAVALGIVAVVALPAQAHTAAITPTVACSTTTPGSSVITWKISNDWHDDATIDAVSGSAAGHLTPNPLNQVLPSTNGGPDTFATFTQTVSGTTSSTLNIHVTWTDGYAQSYSATASGKAGCTTGTPVGSVTPTQAQCDTQHPGQKTSASYLITAGAHVTYAASVNGAAPSAVSAGTPITVPVGGSAVTVVVTPTADSGYALTGYVPSQWTMTFAPVTVDCIQELQVSGVPQVDAPICTAQGTVGSGSVTFPSLLTGATWQYSTTSANGPWTDAPAILTAAGGTTVYVQIIAQPGYLIVSGTTTFTEVIDQTDASTCVVPTPPHPTQAICDTEHPGHIVTASYDVPSTTGVDYRTGSASGPIVAGTVTVSTLPAVITLYATPKAGYTFPAGTTTTFPMTFDQKADGDCVQATVVAKPTFADAVCTPDTRGQITSGSYTLGDVTGVRWHVTVNGSSVAETNDSVVPGTYDVKINDVVVVTETPADGFSLTGYPAGGYTYTFSKNPGDCLNHVTPVTPTFTAQACVVDPTDGSGHLTGGTIDVQVVTGVIYEIDGKKVDTTGKNDGDIVSTAVSTGVAHTVDAVAATGYALDGYQAGDWAPITLTTAELCGDLTTEALVDPSVTTTPAGCFSQGGYVLSSDLAPTITDAVVWTVNGSPIAENSYPLAAGQTVVIDAAPAPGYGFDTGTQTHWVFTGSSTAGACDLKTLALTGTGSPVGWIGLGYLLLVGGIALVGVPLIMRRRRSAG